ncbi:hypothetical protein TYRP_017017 [Tyrophagus putrescentiae]|nr:hypothetical protein TYRP_017017 [Tyrophagus putrescentiae]
MKTRVEEAEKAMVDDQLEKAPHQHHHRPPLVGGPEEEGRPLVVENLPQQTVQLDICPEEENVIEVGGDEGAEGGKEVVLAPGHQDAQHVKVHQLLLVGEG